MRILVVEDEPDAARMLAKGLREQAHAVDVVGDGESACFQAAVADYDAVVLDLRLHVWDEGYDPFSNVIEVYLRRLRRKLDEPGAPQRRR
jgi:DNA-binding response OmpR family regulator